jgi:putative flippase GtrA
VATASLPRQGGQLLRYLLVGGANFLVSWSMLWCFTALFGWPYLVSTAVAFLATTLFGHRGNRFFTFRATDQSYLPQLLRYAVTMLSVLALSLLLMWVLVEGLGIHYLLANVGVAVILAVLGFWVNSRWVFAQGLVATTTNSLNRKNLPTHLGNGNE